VTDQSEDSQPQNTERELLANESELTIAIAFIRECVAAGERLIWRDGSFWVWDAVDHCYDDREDSWVQLEIQSRFWMRAYHKGWAAKVGDKLTAKAVKMGESQGMEGLEAGLTSDRDIPEVGWLKPQGRTAAAVMNCCKAVLHHGPQVRDGDVLAFKNSWVRLDAATREIRSEDPTPSVFVSRGSRVDCDHDPAAPSPDSWLRTLRELWEGVEDCEQRILALHEYLGACLFGYVTEWDKVMLLHGGGSNGKSVVTETLEALLPGEMRSSVMPHEWDNEYYRVHLRGAKVNIVHEIPPRKIMDQSVTKSIISGEPVMARSPAEKPFVFTPRAGHIFSANRLPKTADHTHGFWRRWLVLDFPNTFSGEVKRETIIGRHMDEREGIMRLIVEGALRGRRQNGMTELRQDELLEAWRRDVDPVAAWLEENTRKVDYPPAEWTQTDFLYKHFCSWAEDHGHGRAGQKAMTSKTFNTRMTGLGVALTRFRREGKRVYARDIELL
jgi:P4 family phage/plasmid primase-like protien